MSIEPNNQKPEIPAGFVEDRKGNLVRKEKIKDIDNERDKLVRKIAKQAKDVSGTLAAFRADVFDMVADFVALSSEKYNAPIGGKMGNVALFSFDGSLKVQISRGETKSFDERLQVAKKLIDNCIHDWAKGANKNIQSLIDHAFQVDKQGQVSIERILGLRRLKIEDERWDKAMNAIADSIQITGSKRYFNVYGHIGESDEYRRIPPDAANA
ncbi:MAG: DUF3164 family protein [Ahrensia sp.]|nr:DUF3164 family protein [Ahrensia sp.]